MVRYMTQVVCDPRMPDGQVSVAMSMGDGDGDGFGVPIVSGWGVDREIHANLWGCTIRDEDDTPRTRSQQ